MKTRNIFIFSITAILVFAAGSAFGAYSGGSGTAGDPYQISTRADLLALAADANDYDKCFILTADIDLDPNLPGGQVFTTAIIAPDTNSFGGFSGTAFTGTFDGGGHKVAHLAINGGSNSYLGLFGYISYESVFHGFVKNLGLENCSVSGSSFVGGLVGVNYGSISNCYSTGAVSGTADVGGLVGYHNIGGISNCYSTGTVSSTIAVGGLAGVSSGGSISNCYSTGSISGTSSVGGLMGANMGSISNCYSTGQVSGSSNSQSVGGLVGFNWYGRISNCHSTGTVSGTSKVGSLVGDNNNGTSISNCYSTGAVSGTSYVGGLVGQSVGSISNCYSTGIVSGSSHVGGLVGVNFTGCSISNSYSMGSVSGSIEVGGLVGGNLVGNISNCYSTGTVSGSSNSQYVGGLVGYNNPAGSVIGSFWDTQTSGWATSDGGTGNTTVQLKTLQTFILAGWDFVNVWGIGSGQTYPYLKPFNGTNPADLNYSGTVDFADFAILAENWLSGQ